MNASRLSKEDEILLIQAYKHATEDRYMLQIEGNNLEETLWELHTIKDLLKAIEKYFHDMYKLDISNDQEVKARYNLM